MPDLKQMVLDLFTEMEELGDVIHPAVSDHWVRICEALGIDYDKLPTEGKRLREQYGKGDPNG